jgi:hypothetical protein
LEFWADHHRAVRLGLWFLAAELLEFCAATIDFGRVDDAVWAGLAEDLVKFLRRGDAELGVDSVCPQKKFGAVGFGPRLRPYKCAVEANGRPSAASVAPITPKLPKVLDVKQASGLFPVDRGAATDPIPLGRNVKIPSLLVSTQRVVIWPDISLESLPLGHELGVNGFFGGIDAGVDKYFGVGRRFQV